MKDFIPSLKLLAINSIFGSDPDFDIGASFVEDTAATWMLFLVLGSTEPQNKDCSQVCVKSIGMFRLWDIYLWWEVPDEDGGTSNDAVSSDVGGAIDNESVTMPFHQIVGESWGETQDDIQDDLVLVLDGVANDEANHDAHEYSKCQEANSFVFPESFAREHSNNNSEGNDDEEYEISLLDFGFSQDKEAERCSQKGRTNCQNDLEQGVNNLAALKGDPNTKNDQDNSCYLVIFRDIVFDLLWDFTLGGCANNWCCQR